MTNRRLSCGAQAGRRAIANERANRDQVLEHNRLAVLFDLELPCTCGHELGFHVFITPARPSPCHFSGCGCTNYVRKEDPLLNPHDPTIHDPFAGLVGEPEPESDPSALNAEPFVDVLGESIPLPPVTPFFDGGAAELTRANFAEHLAHSEPHAQTGPWEALRAPVAASDPHPTETSVVFPVVVAGPDSVDVARLLDPAQRVAEIVEALETALAPPLAVQQLMELVATANALTITDGDTYKRGCDLYEELSANAKGIEEGPIGQVVAFFYRPWKFCTTFRAKFLQPVEASRKRLSDDCGRWKLEADRQARITAQREADEAAAAERARLAEIAAAATTAAAAAPVDSPVREVLQQTAVQATEQQKHVFAMPVPTRSTVPQTGTGGRKKWQAVIVDLDVFYAALVADPTRRTAAPIDQAYLNRQAGDMKEELAKRFPGVEAREVGGLTANGRR